MDGESEKLQRGNPYPLGDPLSREEQDRFGLQGQPYFRTATIRAVWTGEKRPPKKGEWYLSGGIIYAYRAPNDFTTEYYIARLVMTKTTTKTEVIG